MIFRIRGDKLSALHRLAHISAGAVDADLHICFVDGHAALSFFTCAILRISLESYFDLLHACADLREASENLSAELIVFSFKRNIVPDSFSVQEFVSKAVTELAAQTVQKRKSRIVGKGKIVNRQCVPLRKLGIFPVDHIVKNRLFHYFHILIVCEGSFAL